MSKLTPNTEYNTMAAKWFLPDTLMGGTQAMRDAGEMYLPRETKEPVVKWLARLARTTLYNQYKKAVNGLVNRPFSRKVNVKECPPKLEYLQDNCDGAGTSLSDFAKEVFKEAVHRGLTYLYIDYSDVPTTLSIAGEAQTGARVLFCHISAKNLIGWKTEIINGVTKLIEIRIKETETVIDADYKSTVKTYVKIIRPNDWERWEVKDGKDSSGSATEVLVKQGQNTLGYIPLIPIYFSQTGYMTGEPCLEDLAWVNLEHYQSSSDQRNILKFARTGLLFISGVTDEEMDKEVTVGPNQTFKTANPNARMAFIEMGAGNAIAAGERDLQKLEDRMEVLGGRPMTSRSGNVTATSKAIDESNDISDIQCWIRATELALERAFDIAAEWHKLPAAKTATATAAPDATPTKPDESKQLEVDIYNEFSLLSGDGRELGTLDNARARGDLTRITWLNEMKRRNILAASVDVEQEDKEAESETLKMFDAEANANAEAFGTNDGKNDDDKGGKDNKDNKDNPFGGKGKGKVNAKDANGKADTE